MSSPVPTEWITDELVRFCDIVGGGTPDRAVHEYWGGQIPWVSPTEVTSLASKYISKTKEGLTQLGLDKSSAKLHPPGTLLMTSRASIGYVAINTVPMATNQGFQSLRCKDGTLADYMYQYITWVRPELERLSAGSTFSEISSVNVKRLRVTLPPRPEQQKIATILSSVDDVIEKTRAQIDKLKDLKTGMMQELLTKGIGHTEFKDSPVGRIPAEWELKTLAECCSLIRDGTHLPPKRVPDGIPLLSVRNIQNGKFSLLDDDTYVTRDFYEKMHAKWKPESGDLLLTVVGATVGKVAQVPKNFPIFTLQRSVAVLRGKENILDNDFLYEFSQSEMFNVEFWDRVNQTAQPGIYLAEIGKIRAPMPSIEEQKIIAKRLQSVANNFAIKSQKLEFLINAKKALMQDLLTGKVRVKLTDKESAAV